MDTGGKRAQCPRHCCVLSGHRWQCPGWTQPRRQSHCASAIVRPVAQVQILETIRVLLVLLLFAQVNSPKGSQKQISIKQPLSNIFSTNAFQNQCPSEFTTTHNHYQSKILHFSKLKSDNLYLEHILLLLWWVVGALLH